MARGGAESLDRRLGRVAAGASAQVALEVLLEPVLDVETAYLDRLIDRYRAGSLTAEQALAGIGALAGLRTLLVELEARVRAGQDAAARLTAPEAEG